MIDNLRIMIPTEMFERVPVPSSPFSFNFPLHEIRLPQAMHNWLIENADHVSIDIDRDYRGLIFDSEEYAALFWLNFSDDFNEVKKQQRSAADDIIARIRARSR